MKKMFLGMMITALLILSACSLTTVSGSLEQDAIEIKKDSSTELEVALEVGVGELRVSEGANEWVEGNIEYNVDKLDPKVSYELIDHKGHVVISQDDGKFGINNIGDVQNNWDIKLTNEIPIDLQIDAGVSDTELDLRGLQLNNLKIDAGVGDITLDLSGDWEQGFNTHFSAGVGSSTITLPSDFGVIIETDKGIVSADYINLKSLGEGVYVNDAYDASNQHIKLNMDLGIGDVTFKVE
ncbi:toast rack family protein [Chengkuizengella axinellae]|uniref:Toast rack family protein n=1 Tax=Chengkuizengella axinellae TaxID=3064388 RepID=A0ABT9IZI4_9BACL|nr:toast rack family protein [Chengkuizengella sp. 2205SS18-9]MDP5274763.1 toast rack family protein [Chengkuizengella sp. 2205SS18-9]